MNGTGENEQGLRKILDLTRLGSLLILGLHFFYFCDGAFRQWDLTTVITDRLLKTSWIPDCLGTPGTQKGSPWDCWEFRCRVPRE